MAKKPKPPAAVARRAPARRATTEREVLATARALGAALHQVGAMDAATMRDLDVLCLPPRPEDGGRGGARVRMAA